MAMLTERPARPVRWRRDLRAACFWAALALGGVAVAKELALSDLVVALAAAPAVVGLRDAVRALGSRRAGKLAERVASRLRSALGADFVVLTEYAPRDGSAVVPLVVVGPPGIFVVEPNDEDATFGCYRDGWHRLEAQGVRHLADSPSRRARDGAARVRTDISSGGHIRAKVDAFVLLERGRGDGCASSPVPVVCGTDALARALLALAPRREASARYTRAVAEALTQPLTVATA